VFEVVDCAGGDMAKKPMMKNPATFTINVPQGKVMPT
jgi:hypothetical protein